MFEASVSGWFAAAHQLRLPDGALEPLHGHNWSVTALFRAAQLDAMGLVIDFIAARQALVDVLAEMHDRHLNELPAFAELNPSAENVARVIANKLEGRLPNRRNGRLVAVWVEESPGCIARYWLD